MGKFCYKILRTYVVTGIMLFAALTESTAQDKNAPSIVSVENDTVKADKMFKHQNNVMTASTDSVAIKKHKRDWNTWRPDTKRALWLAIVLPGAGQIYNRKYWKVPIVYGGFVGCVYAMTWNNMMYKDYSQAYLDIMDDDPNTHSYEQFLHLGTQVTNESLATYQRLFKSRKDIYRRWRDLSIFCLIGVYALSVIDAYVDASLSEFDISPNLSMTVAPAVINNNMDKNLIKSSALGLQCSLKF